MVCVFFLQNLLLYQLFMPLKIQGDILEKWIEMDSFEMNENIGHLFLYR